MKTLTKLIMPALVLVFINYTIEAQTVVATEVFNNPDYIYEGSSRSSNGQYVTVTVDYNSEESAVIKLLERQSDGTYNSLLEYDNFIPDGGTHDIRVNNTPVSNNRIMYNDYMQGWVGDNILCIFEKILTNGSNVRIFEYRNGSSWNHKNINGDLYIFFVVGADFDPGTLGGLPNLNEGWYLIKIDGTTDQYVWSSPVNDFIWASDVEIMIKPGDNDHIYLTRADGSLVKFSRSTGANIGTVKEGNEGDKYKFDEDGNLHRLVSSEHSLIIYDENDNYNSILYETDWSQWNLWNTGMRDWKIIDGLFYGINSTQILHLDKKLIHGYINHRNPYISNYVEGSVISWVNNDGTYGYIGSKNNVINILTVTEEPEDESLIPSLNDSDDDIVAVIDGQTYDGENWNESYHQSTIVFKDGTLPSIGETPDEDWINAAPGTHLMVLFPIELDPRGNNLMFRGAYRVDGTAEHDIHLKVILKEESDVVLAVNDVDNIDISIYPNPARDFINISSSSNIESVVVYDVAGRVIIEIDTMTPSHRINKSKLNISNLNSGIYFVKISGNFGVVVERFVKE
ncbi:MAG: T9SS type A sorting domain-containing protein [Bacteroidales bacterium]|nr:T9SS type A sorting domain-containing protein [Bacteroidales bacterium]